jgi:hypothetical protein
LSKKLDVPLMGFYERLSEFAHPNYHGMMATYTDEGGEGGLKTFCDRRMGTERPLILIAPGAIAASCDIIVESFKIFESQLEALAILAEGEIMAKSEDLEMDSGTRALHSSEHRREPDQHGHHRLGSLSLVADKFNGANT